MRIAFYAPLKPPTHDIPSGDRRVARLLMDALRLAGHVVELVSDFRSFDGRGDAARQAEIREQGGAIATRLIHQWRDRSEASRPDLWFTYHLYYKAPDWLGPDVSAELGIPYVVAEASHAPKRAGGAWAIGHAAVGRAIRAANLLLCPTRDDFVGLQLVGSVNTPLLRLAPFLDPAPYRLAAGARAAHRERLRAAHDLAATGVWLLATAMMRLGDKLESYRMLAAVLRSVIDMPWQLLVVGDGPARMEVQALLGSAVPGRTRFLGECNADVLAGVYAACDVFVWPAVNEAYGMAMLEAQAAGLPVVSRAVRGVPDVVCDGRTGLLSRADEGQEMAVLVRRLLLDSPSRLAMGRAAAQFVDDERSTVHAASQLRIALEGLPVARKLIDPVAPI